MDEMKLEPCPFDGSRDIKLCCAGIGRYYHHCGLCNVQTETRATPELAAEAWNRRQPQSAEWVPWKEGDPLPPDGLYWATFRYTSAAGNPNSVPRCEVKQVGFGYWQTNAEILAYIPQRLPDPYTDAQGKRLPEREECEK